LTLLDLLIYLVRQHLINILALATLGIELADFDLCLLEVIDQHFQFLLINVLELLGTDFTTNYGDVEEACCSTSLLSNSLKFDVHDLFVLNVDYWFLNKDE